MMYPAGLPGSLAGKAATVPDVAQLPDDSTKNALPEAHPPDDDDAALTQDLPPHPVTLTEQTNDEAELHDEKSRAAAEETEAAPEADGQVEVDPDPEVAEADEEPASDLHAEVDAEAEANVEPEVEPEAQAETQAQVDPDTQPDVDTEAQAEVENHAEVDAQPEVAGDVEPEVEVVVETEGTDQGDVVPDAEAGPDAEILPDADAGILPEASAEVLPEADTEILPEADTEAVPGTDAVPEDETAEGEIEVVRDTSGERQEVADTSQHAIVVAADGSMDVGGDPEHTDVAQEVLNVEDNNIARDTEEIVAEVAPAADADAVMTESTIDPSLDPEIEHPVTDDVDHTAMAQGDAVISTEEAQPHEPEIQETVVEEPNASEFNEQGEIPAQTAADVPQGAVPESEMETEQPVPEALVEQPDDNIAEQSEQMVGEAPTEGAPQTASEAVVETATIQTGTEAATDAMQEESNCAMPSEENGTAQAEVQVANGTAEPEKDEPVADYAAPGEALQTVNTTPAQQQQDQDVLGQSASLAEVNVAPTAESIEAESIEAQNAIAHEQQQQADLAQVTVSAQSHAVTASGLSNAAAQGGMTVEQVVANVSSDAATGATEQPPTVSIANANAAQMQASIAAATQAAAAQVPTQIHTEPVVPHAGSTAQQITTSHEMTASRMAAASSASVDMTDVHPVAGVSQMAPPQMASNVATLTTVPTGSAVHSVPGVPTVPTVTAVPPVPVSAVTVLPTVVAVSQGVTAGVQTMQAVSTLSTFPAVSPVPTIQTAPSVSSVQNVPAVANVPNVQSDVLSQQMTPVATTASPVIHQSPQAQAPQIVLPNAAVQDKEEDPPLVEVVEAMMAANEVFSRVKSEKIAEQALCSIRNDQSQYEGLAKEIVGKAIKQKERERANRASAAASRAKVLRYQTELENRLNRMEAERNAYKKELTELQPYGEEVMPTNLGEQRHLTNLLEWIKKLEAVNPNLVRSVINPAEMQKVLMEPQPMYVGNGGEQPDIKRRRI